MYIGQTKDRFIERYWSHKWNLLNGTHFNRNLQNSFNKQNEDCFEFRVLKVCDESDDFDSLEIEYINKFNSIEKGYNIQKGGKPFDLSKYITKETRKQVGLKNKKRLTGSKLSEKTKEKMRNSSKHLSPSKENIEHLRSIMTNRIVSQETRSKLRQANLGEKSPVAVMNEEKVKLCRKMFEEGYNKREISKHFNVSYGTICAILSGRTWSHVK